MRNLRQSVRELADHYDESLMREIHTLAGTDDDCDGTTLETVVSSDHDDIEILGEIVGATELLTEDDDTFIEDVRPYCVVKFADGKIHQTKPDEGLSPVWTIDTNSLFLIKTTPHDLAESMLSVKIWTKRTTALTEVRVFLGQISMKPSDIVAHCDGERFEVHLEDELGEDQGRKGKLALRLRMATPADSKFVSLWNSNSHIQEKKILKAMLDEEDERCKRPLAEIITERSETKIAGATFMNAISTAFRATSYVEAKSGLQKIRVKPHPDPKRKKVTEYLTPHDLKVETRRPSETWVEAGSGNLGKLYVEILSCHDLPNVDVGEAVGNVTDSFVALVFEDAFVQTPVIDDELSPQWPPWTQRAFSFGIMHPASMLYLGVFDYDLGPVSEHEPIGRVAINISNLQRDTLYTLKYDLHKSSNVDDRTPNGSVTVRLRMEIFDEKQALMAGLKPMPIMHVNVKKKKSFKVVRYTCFGQYDGEQNFDLSVTRSYINEIFENKRHLQYSISDSFWSLIFWRGQVEVFSLLLPLHSFIFFCITSTLVERPHLLPSFSIMSVAWLLLANGRIRHQHPNPWRHQNTFFHYLEIFVHGKSKPRIKRIDPNEGWEEAKAYEEAFKKREEADVKKAEKRAMMQKELSSVDVNINTVVKGGLIPIDLLERLGRYQTYIGYVCNFIRRVKIILLWEESIISFWITAVFLGAGLVSLLLPWRFILTWTGRIVVYGLFGPQMKVVDLWMRANKTDDIKSLMEAFDRKKRLARMRRERALKVSAVKKLRFGEFITQVPNFSLARHYDHPLPDSSAKYLRKNPKVELGPYLPGQQLFGDMIPRLENGHLSNHEISLKRMESLTALKDRLTVLRAALKLRGGLHALRLRRNRTEEEQPESSGYELIQLAQQTMQQSLSELTKVPAELEWMKNPLDVSTGQLSIPQLESMNLCVVPFDEVATNEPASEGDYSCKRMRDSSVTDEGRNSLARKEMGRQCFDEISEGEGMEIEVQYCESEAVTLVDDFEQEEGIEIVACGRLTGNADMYNLGNTCDETYLEGDQGNLSVLYRESDSTFLTFYRA